jgi:hypothetical protein
MATGGGGGGRVVSGSSSLVEGGLWKIETFARRREVSVWYIFRCLGDAAARRVEEGETTTTETGLPVVMKV